MNLPELLSRVPDLLAYYDDETGEPLTGATRLAWEALVVDLLSESFDFEGDDQAQLHQALDTISQLEHALRTRVYNPLHAALKSMDEDQELIQAQAALVDAKVNGTIAWEEIKAALGLGDARYVVDGYDTRARVLREEQLRYLTPNQIRYAGSIGRLFHSGKFVCHTCALTYDLVAEQASAVYPINIIPYSQSCHECRKVLVEGWDCQLFSAPKSKWAAIRLEEGLPRVDFTTVSDTADEAEAFAGSDTALNFKTLGEYPVIGVVAVEGGA